MHYIRHISSVTFDSSFGCALKEREFSGEKYRYGFQNQEMDDELKGEGNSINFTYRMHDTRLGRFFAVDPLWKDYAYYSSYQFSGNRLIDMIEFEGMEPKGMIIHVREHGELEKATEDIINMNNILNQINNENASPKILQQELEQYKSDQKVRILPLDQYIMFEMDNPDDLHFIDKKTGKPIIHEQKNIDLPPAPDLIEKEFDVTKKEIEKIEIIEISAEVPKEPEKLILEPTQEESALPE